MPKTLCIYHANCADGLAAAAVVGGTLGFDNVEFLAANYGDAPPDVTGVEVMIVDFSYPRETIIAMAQAADAIMVIDHHATAQEQLVDLPENVDVVFDMRYSGAMLTWRFFYTGEEPPELICAVQDRDLWHFDLDTTQAAIACAMSLPDDPRVWNRLIFDWKFVDIVRDGEAISRAQLEQIRRHVAANEHKMQIGPYEVPAINAPKAWASDAAHMLCPGQPFAVAYFDNGKVREFSLRSSKVGGADVRQIAESFGGGGHKHAAGYKVRVD
jgi:oligoribonuclease NrnB/cAMP/cGMP phosphodiesterase (DHH superfamily)